MTSTRSAARSTAEASRISPVARVMPSPFSEPARASSRTSATTSRPRAFSPRARCPPVKPVPPVTRTRTGAIESLSSIRTRVPLRDERDRRSEHAAQAQPVQGTLNAAGGCRGSELLVNSNRQHELLVRPGDPETVRRQRVAYLAVAEHAIRLDPGTKRVRDAPGNRLKRGGARSRRVVEDNAVTGSAAEFGERLPPVGGVHQHAQADDCVERAVGDVQAVRVALDERDRCTSIESTTAGHGKH